ncbi:hypothetical protein [Nonomuraea sp. CA-141351]|uniref:hypothetical protein n=1 Tax=Nonomuraea sp. CA-141351 TaxID=3239996 RepID=UPI003D8C00D5
MTMAAIDRGFAPADLERMLDSTGMDASVIVQSTNSAAETRRILAHPSPRIAGVVGWADLTADVAEQLDELDTMARRRPAGIGHLAHVDPDPAWLGRPDVGTALEQLGARDLGFDLDVRWWPRPSWSRILACVSSSTTWAPARQAGVAAVAVGKRSPREVDEDLRGSSRPPALPGGGCCWRGPRGRPTGGAA